MLESNEENLIPKKASKDAIQPTFFFHITVYKNHCANVGWAFFLGNGIWLLNSIQGDDFNVWRKFLFQSKSSHEKGVSLVQLSSKLRQRKALHAIFPSFNIIIF